MSWDLYFWLWLYSDHPFLPFGITAWSQFFSIWQQHSVTMLNPGRKVSVQHSWRKWPKYFPAEGERDQLDWGHLRVYDVYEICRQRRHRGMKRKRSEMMEEDGEAQLCLCLHNLIFYLHTAGPRWKFKGLCMISNTSLNTWMIKLFTHFYTQNDLTASTDSSPNR